MAHTTYILYSEKISRYYVGSTSQVLEKRMIQHLSNHKGFTGKAKDWVVIYSREHTELQNAREEENKIKKQGAKRYLERR